MDWFRTIEEQIFGDDWARLSVDKKDIADRVLSWCVENRAELPDKPIYKALWSDKVAEVVNDTLLEVYGKGIGFYMQKNRSRKIYDIRTTIFAILYALTNCTAISLARRYGYHHTTVLHALREHDNLMQTDREYKEKFNNLESKIYERCEELLM